MLLGHLQMMLQAGKILLRELFHFRIRVLFRRLLIQRDGAFMSANLLIHELLVEISTRSARQLIEHALMAAVQLVGNLDVLLIGQFLQLIEGLLMVLHDGLRKVLGLLVLRFCLGKLACLHLKEVLLIRHFDELLRIRSRLTDSCVDSFADLFTGRLSAGGVRRAA